MSAKDSNGTELSEGDPVQVIKDLKVKGTSSTPKRGTVYKNIRHTSKDDEIECGKGKSTVVLKTCFLKKTQDNSTISLSRGFLRITPFFDALIWCYNRQTSDIYPEPIIENPRLNFNLIKKAIYATFLTNKIGFKLKRVHTSAESLELRCDYAKNLLSKLGINVEVHGKEKLVKGGQYLLVSNHRSIIDPLIIEIALRGTNIYGHWIAKKELYNSFFFGLFTRNAGTILLDRDSKQMNSFFKNTKKCVAQGDSIFVFPEGTRTKDDARLSEFKDGSQLIAVKNRLNILPVYIKTDSNDALKHALRRRPQASTVVIEIGDVIDYKDRSMGLEESYRKMFGIIERRMKQRNV